ncbi:polymer-forming cytoskeletal protein [Paenibacillus gansuensis]|uniref:Polymer-forming cytoskeletal protein n=1 Tax=Paenibacillus gansuensis TaxID=306542 RepID=A0ABW5PJD3_9BACL
MDGNELKINGIGKAGGGEYSKVHMEGIGDVEGDLSCNTCYINGVANIDGSVKADHFKANGKLKIKGHLHAEQVEFDGQMTVEGSMSAAVSRLNGLVKIRGDCEAETFHGAGGFVVGGLLNADLIEIELYGRSKAKEIGGTRVHVIKTNKSDWSQLFSWAVPSLKSVLEANVIEADEIYLEKTKAGTVRGNNVELGAGCIVETVEYRGELKVHSTAKVGKKVKV